MSSIKYTSTSVNKWGLVEQGKVNEYEFTERNHSGLILLVGVLLIIAIGVFIYLNWNAESLLLSLTLAYRVRGFSNVCVLFDVSSFKLNDGRLTYNRHGKSHDVENVEYIEGIS